MEWIGGFFLGAFIGYLLSSLFFVAEEKSENSYLRTKCKLLESELELCKSVESFRRQTEQFVEKLQKTICDFANTEGAIKEGQSWENSAEIKDTEAKDIL